MADSTIIVKLNMPQILDKVQNNEFGKFLSSEWHDLLKQYTPHRDGFLQKNVTYKPFEFTYHEPYAHYMYTGIVYGPNLPIDSEGKLVFPFDESRVEKWKSPHIHKYPTERRFNYGTDPNPFATDHWDKAAEASGQKEKLIEAINIHLRRQSNG